MKTLPLYQPKICHKYQGLGKKLTKQDHIINSQFLQNLSVRLGDGSGMNFWDVMWISNQALKNLYPTLYRASSQKSATIANIGWFEGGVWRWTLLWERQLSTAELQHATELCNLLQQSEAKRIMYCGVRRSFHPTNCRIRCKR